MNADSQLCSATHHYAIYCEYMTLVILKSSLATDTHNYIDQQGEKRAKYQTK